MAHAIYEEGSNFESNNRTDGRKSDITDIVNCGDEDPLCRNSWRSEGGWQSKEAEGDEQQHRRLVHAIHCSLLDLRRDVRDNGDLPRVKNTRGARSAEDLYHQCGQPQGVSQSILEGLGLVYWLPPVGGWKAIDKHAAPKRGPEVKARLDHLDARDAEPSRGFPHMETSLWKKILKGGVSDPCEFYKMVKRILALITNENAPTQESYARTLDKTGMDEHLFRAVGSSVTVMKTNPKLKELFERKCPGMLSLETTASSAPGSTFSLYG